MQRIEVERTIAAPIQRVWDVYTDHASWSRWAGVGKSWLETKGSPDPNGVGALRALGNGPVVAYEEVLEFEPPRRMTYTVVRGGLPMKNHQGEVLFDDRGDTTHVVWRCRFESRLPGLAAPMRIVVTRVFRQALEGLSRHLASGAS